MTQRCPNCMLFAEGAKAQGLAYLEKKKKRGDESARVGGDAPEHNGRSSVGSKWAAL